MSELTSGLEGVTAFATDIAEPDKDGGALRYRGIDIEELLRARAWSAAPSNRGDVPAPRVRRARRGWLVWPTRSDFDAGGSG